jgi:O-antigen/teichoic acid export membrane protein
MAPSPAAIDMIGRNALSNALGGGWAAILNLALIPIEIRALGLEAFGLLGFLASLQILFSLFDLGLSPAMTWHVARDESASRTWTKNVLSTVLPAYGVLGLVLGLLIVSTAPWLAANWLRLGLLPVPEAVSALRFGGIALALRWPVSMLTGVLAGVQRFDLLNIVKAIHVSILFTGGAALLLLAPSLIAFTGWLALAALVEILLYSFACLRALPGTQPFAAATRRDLLVVWRYARRIALVTVISLVLTQSDRLLLGRLAGVTELGRYSAVYNLVFGLTLLQLFITSAAYPSFSADHARGEFARLRSHYRDATQVLMYLYVLPFCLLFFFGQPILEIFTGREVANSSAPLLGLLAVGFLFNAASAVAYALTLATGKTGLPIAVNAVNLLWYLPGLGIAIIAWGAMGAGLMWTILNASYLLSFIPRVQRGLVNQSMREWLLRWFLPFPLVGFAVFAFVRLIVGTSVGDDPVSWATVVAVSGIYLVSGFQFLSPDLQRQARLIARGMG